jgi:mitochondrial import inner membrane translocase subunit TIM44
MLPRHARYILLSSLRSTATNNLITARVVARRPVAVTSSREFHSSSQRRNELPKSPFQTFVEVLKEEIQKDRQLQDNMKQLSGDVDKLQDSEAMKKTRELYERARVRLSTTQDPWMLAHALDS